MRLSGEPGPLYRRFMGKQLPPFWDGLALRRSEASADPDAPPRRVALPAAWDDGAAAALAALAPGTGAVTLPAAAEAWIGRLAARAEKAGHEPGRLAESLRALLLARRGAPGAPLWRGETPTPRFVLRLTGFVTEAGFDAES
jgi:ribonucleoside-diphosphate reductase alpha chain